MNAIASTGSSLALNGGPPVRTAMLPYGRQSIDEDDIQAVVAALRSDWLTTGPRVAEFERAFADFVGAHEAVAVNSGTAALHAAMAALDIGPGDEVIVPAMTFAATANAVVYRGGMPVFADVEADTLLIDAKKLETHLTAHTKAIAAVDYAGHPCNYDALRAIAKPRGIALVADACHAIGGSYRDESVGTLADLNTFSLHPVKSLTTGEGGVITTADAELAARMRIFRNHGISTDHRQREAVGSWIYEMVELGYNYRITDFQCALGTSQLLKLRGWVNRRQAIAKIYDEAFGGEQGFAPLAVRPDVRHGYHLYVIRLQLERLSAPRQTVFAALRAEGIGVNVHYIPVHLHPYYRERLGTGPGLCPVAEAAYEELITLPVFPAMADTDVADVIEAVKKVVSHYR
jgi:perosamine synthetase